MKHIVKNVLTNKERKKLIADCKPHLIDGKELGKKYAIGVGNMGVIFIIPTHSGISYIQ